MMVVPSEFQFMSNNIRSPYNAPACARSLTIVSTMPNGEQRGGSGGGVPGFNQGSMEPSNLSLYKASSFTPINKSYQLYQSPSLSRNACEISRDSETLYDISTQELTTLPRKSNKRQLLKGTKYLTVDEEAVEVEDDTYDVFEVCSPEENQTATPKRPKPRPSKQHRVARSKSERVFDVIKESKAEQADGYSLSSNFEFLESAKPYGQSNTVLVPTATESLSFLDNERSTQNCDTDQQQIITTAEKVMGFDGLTKTTIDTLSKFRYNADATNSSIIKRTGSVQELSVTEENGSHISKPLLDFSEENINHLATSTPSNPTVITGCRGIHSRNRPGGRKIMASAPKGIEPDYNNSDRKGNTGVMNSKYISHTMSNLSNYDGSSRNCLSDRMLSNTFGTSDDLLNDDIADVDLLSLVNGTPTALRSDFVLQDQSTVHGVNPHSTSPPAKSFDTGFKFLQDSSCSQHFPESLHVKEFNLLPSYFDESDRQYHMESEDEKEMISILGAETHGDDSPIGSLRPPSAFAKSSILETPPRANFTHSASNRITRASPEPSGLPTPVSMSKRGDADKLRRKDDRINPKISTCDVAKFSFENEILKPFARPNFPAPVFDRCPVMGVSSRTILRTCFRIGEMLREGRRCKVTNQNAIIELYARVISSARESYSMKQHFKFADLFHERPPFPTGLLLNYKTTGLMEIETNRFLQTSESVLARCLGTIQKDAKAETWSLQITNIRETNWNEIAMTRRVICGTL
ncbi:hypothetical protein F5884DRAFT_206453 [Xylogone sp. PMI_703]|nr:hypothetical protein F5884DRAFT_206453 [Xylogone sp. PMI_703]